ncbi:MAG: PA14 domain-containing protein, partial [Candidatus Brocadiia bacterium]
MYTRKGKIWAFLLMATIVAGLAAVQPQGATGADLTADYTWDFVKIGGFTWFTNIYVHPGGAGPIFNNSDTACPYRWDEANQKWVPVVTADSMPDPGGYLFDYDWETTDGEPGTPAPNGLSLVGAPSNANVAYLAYQDQLSATDSGNVYRSTDQGDTWTLPNGGTLNLFMAPNGTARQSGPRLAVDPADENVVYFGSQKDGLWRTTDGAQSWTQVTDVPVPADENGVTCVDIDPNSGTTGGLTNTVYASVSGSGVYRTTDAGGSWTNIGGPTAWVRAAKVGGDGTYYAADSNGALHRYSGGSWADISPGSIYGVAVDPFDANRVVAVNKHSETYLSTNKGDNWSQLGYSVDYNGIAAQAQRASVDRIKLAFDTGVQDKLWAAEAYGLWQCDISAGTADWTCVSHGTEGYASHSIVKPPGGGVLTGQMDGGVYHHPDPGQYSSEQVCTTVSNWQYTNGWGVDYCVADPTFIAAASTPGNQWVDDHSGYSNGEGAKNTWTKFSSLPGYDGQTPTGIAVSATDPDNIVVYDGSQNNVYRTTDCGSSWSGGTNLGTPMITGWGPGVNAIAADRVDGGTFYVYDWGNGGVLWRTTDGGANWTDVSTALPGANMSDISATPGQAGHVWFCADCGNCGGIGLYRSTDYGATWSQISGVDLAISVCLGKADDGATYPTIYLYGTVGGVEGVFRSTDEAASWDKIANVAPMGLYAGCLSSTADQDVFGTAYFNLGGIGSAYGELTGGDTTPPAAPTGLAATAVSDTQIDLDWDDNTEPDLDSYNVYRDTVQIATGVTVSNYSDTGLAASTQYCYTVTAVDTSANESADSNQDCATTQADTTAPAAPTNLTATAGDTQVSLDWDDNTEPDLDGYYVYRDTSSGGPYTQIATVYGASNHTDTGLTNGTTYYYVVTAFDTSANESGYSNEASATPQVGGDGLTGDYYDNMDFTNHALTRIDPTVNFDWGSGSPDPSMGADTFSVRWTGQVEPLYSETYTFYTTSDDGVRLWVDGQQIIDNWTDHASTEDSGTIALSAGTKYDIQLDYYENTGGAVIQLSWSSASQAKEIIPQSQLYSSGGDTTPPADPTGLSATAGDGQVSLNWDDNTEGDLDSYNVYRDTASGGPYTQIATGVATSDYTDTGVTNDTTYYYVVTAVDTSSNESGYSNEASATPTDSTPPGAPTNLSATAGDGQVDLDWDDNAEGDLDSYNVYRDTTS